MSRLATMLAALAICGMTQNAARAADSCKFAEWGYSYYRIQQRDEVWTYLLTASGPNWRTMPLGRHGPGQLACANCSPASSETGGPFHFIARAVQREEPLTGAERARRRKEWFGYPPVPLRPEDLEHHGSREGIVIGPLIGYAIIDRLVASSD